MKDGHIWDEIEKIETEQKSVSVLCHYLELLLKFDWERSKEEVQFQFAMIVLKIFQAIQIVFFLGVHIAKEPSSHWISWIIIILVLFQGLILETIKKNHIKFEFIFIILFVVPVFFELLELTKLFNISSLGGLFVFIVIFLEFMVLKYLETIEKTYVEEIKRYIEQNKRKRKLKKKNLKSHTPK